MPNSILFACATCSTCLAFACLFSTPNEIFRAIATTLVVISTTMLVRIIWKILP